MNPYDIQKILSVLPHRYPMILIDRVLEVTPGERIVAFKNVSMNEPFFHGHFPDQPVMPGVLIVEGMVQSGALLLYETLPDVDKNRICFAGIDGARFRQLVMPGDQLVFRVELERRRAGVMKMAGRAFVEDRRVAEAKLMALIGGYK